MLWTDFLNKFQPMFEEPGEGTPGAGGEPNGGEPAANPEGEPPEGEPAPNKSLISGEGGEDDDEPPAFEPATVDAFTVPEGAPEGSEFDTDQLEEFIGHLNNGELSRQELGQALINMQFKAMQDAADAAQQEGQNAWDTTVNEWIEQSRALPEIGGENLEKSLAQIKNGLVQLGATKATFEALDLTGAGSHPELVKIFYAATKNLTEGTVVPGAPSKEPLSRADRMFGGQQQKD